MAACQNAKRLQHSDFQERFFGEREKMPALASVEDAPAARVLRSRQLVNGWAAFFIQRSAFGEKKILLE
jgi:hypothetical protein